MTAPTKTALVTTRNLMGLPGNTTAVLGAHHAVVDLGTLEVKDAAGHAIALFGPTTWASFRLVDTPQPTTGPAADAVLQDEDAGPPSNRECDVISGIVATTLMRLRGVTLTHGDTHALIRRALQP